MTDSTTDLARTPADGGPLVRDEQLEQYRHDGFCVLPSVLPDPLLALLLEEGDRAVEIVDAEMDHRRVDVLDGNRRGRQYTPAECRLTQPRLRDFLFSPLMRAVCAQLVGTECHLVWDQFSMKMGTVSPGSRAVEFGEDGNPQSLGRFSWHQDSGYVPKDHPPYLTCWVALDDITARNGALRVIPFSELGIRTRVTHLPDPHNGDLVGYFGAAPGTVLEVPRGSMICFASTVFHSSLRNETDSPRRAYLAQYSSSIVAADGTPLWSNAERLSP